MAYTYHIGGQLRMNFIAEDVPPQLQKLGHVAVTLRSARLTSFRVEIDQPRLQLSDKVQDFHVLPESVNSVGFSTFLCTFCNVHSLLEGRQIRIACCRTCIVHERQTARNVFGRPIRKVQIQQTLIAAIETALFDSKVGQLGKLIGARSVHEHTGVEAVRPADIRSSGEFFTFE